MRNKKRIVTVGCVIGCIGLALLTSFIPISEYTSYLTREEVRGQLQMGTLLALWFTVGVWLFTLGLKALVSQARQSYFLICGGAVLIGLSKFWLPLSIAYLGQWNASLPKITWTLLALVGMLLILVGTYRLNQIITTTRRFTPLYILVGLGVVIFGAIALLPHPQGTAYASSLGWWGFNIVYTANLIEVLTAAFIVTIIYRLRSYVSKSYNKALGWLAIFAGLEGISVLRSVLIEWSGTPGLLALLSMLALILAPLAFIRAGYLASEAFALGRSGQSTVRPSWIDIVVYAASLATRPRDIDSTLDTMRQITSRMNPGAALSSTDEGQLRGVYLSIEQYLTKNEPIIKYDQTALRERVKLRFAIDDRSWQDMLSTKT